MFIVTKNYGYVAVFVLAIALLTFLLNANTSKKPQSIFTQQAKDNASDKITNKINQTTFKSEKTEPQKEKASSASTTYNPNLPPGFPKPLSPIDENELQQNDELIIEGDAIIVKMDALIQDLDLPKVKLSEQEQEKRNAQYQSQQLKIQDLKTQLEKLKGNL